MPIYPGAVLEQSVVGDELDPTEHYGITGASAAEVIAWYAAEMPPRGWTAASDPLADFVQYHTVEGCYAFVAVYARDDGSVEIQLSRQRADSPCVPYVTAPAGED